MAMVRGPPTRRFSSDAEEDARWNHATVNHPTQPPRGLPPSNHHVEQYTPSDEGGARCGRTHAGCAFTQRPTDDALWPLQAARLKNVTASAHFRQAGWRRGVARHNHGARERQVRLAIRPSVGTHVSRIKDGRGVLGLSAGEGACSAAPGETPSRAPCSNWISILSPAQEGKDTDLMSPCTCATASAGSLAACRLPHDPFIRPHGEECYSPCVVRTRRSRVGLCDDNRGVRLHAGRTCHA
jgi:hypothetical protein